MNEKVNVLITGCGGDIGQSVIKILKELDFIDKVVGCDIHVEHPSIFLCDSFEVISKVNEPSYLERLDQIIDKYEIDLIIPVSEPELRFHSTEKVFRKFQESSDIQVIIPNDHALKVGFDKLLTANFLRDKGMPYLVTEMAGEVKDLKFPCILKDRFGAGSKLNFVVQNKLKWDFYVAGYSNLICQEYVDNREGEYTCGLFRHNGICRTIVFKRQLHGGYSGYGEVCRNKAIEGLLVELADKLELDGSINVQLRLENGVPKIFEINPRFSSTVLFRHLFGFNDLLWSIQGALKGGVSAFVPPSEGRKFYKGFQEYIS